MSVKRILTVVLSTAVVVGFIGLGITDAVNRKDKVDFQHVQLKSRSAEIKELNVRYDELNMELQKTSEQDKLEKQEVERLQREKKELDKQKKELEAQLQAKLELESRQAVASASVVNETATQPSRAAPAPSGGSLESIIAAAATKYGVSYDMMIRIATCESTMGTQLRNPTPVIVGGVNYGHAEGVFQFIPSTWTRMSSQAGYGGASVYDTVANVNTAAWAFSTGHKGEWECV